MKKFKNTIKSLAAALLLMVSVFGKAQAQPTTRLTSAENRVAILPITYIGEGNEIKLDEMQYRLQNIAYAYLRSEAMELKFQDPAETNALLRKNGVRDGNIREFTPRELAEMLHVEYVLMGMVSQETVGESTNTNSGRYDHRYRHHREVRFRTENSRTRLDLNTNIDLTIYNDRGENIFTKSRRSILTNVDAYKNGMQYLLKRSPIYRR